jgi:DNA-directed RNA polymerase II subunit RPB9
MLQQGSLVHFVMIHFCPECNNILYPQENRAQKRLLYYCRNCEHIEESEAHIVYRNNLIQKAQGHQIEADILSDPTFPRCFNAPCPLCGSMESVYFVNSDRNSDRPLELTYVCANIKCGHHWGS